jgi:peptide/nickel transport system ATP-binding protein
VTTPVLEVDDLHVTYRMGSRSLPAIRGVDLRVERGEIVGILGESGCGKSTLGMTIPRLLPPNGSISGGRILLEGRDLTALSDTEIRAVRGARVGMIFQDPLTSLNPVFPIGAQMTAAKRAHGTAPKKQLMGEAAGALTQVGIPDAKLRLRDHPHQFSGGMNQRIMIATALSLRPALLIADEPTSALDVTLQAEIVGLLMQLRDTAETAIVVISHDPVMLAQACDRLVVMYAGEVVEASTTHAILDEPKHPYTRALLDAFPTTERRRTTLPVVPGHVPPLWDWPGGCAFADRCAFVQPVCRASTPPLSDAGGSKVRCVLYGDHAVAPPPPRPIPDPGVRVSELEEPPPSSDATPIVVVDDLAIHFSSRRSIVGAIARRPAAPVRAVDGVDLTIGPGEIVGLVGESGSGKTTLGRAVLGLIPPTSGSVSFEGRDLARLGQRELQRLRRNMQLISQDAYGSLSPRKRVDQLLTSPYEIHDMPQDQRYSVEELLDMVELRSDLARKYPHELSGGQARRVGVARALALGPDLVVADEPTAGLDASAAASILNLLRSLRTRLGLALLIITHDLNVVGYLADHVAVMYLGKILEVAPAAEILVHPTHPYTRALQAAHAASGGGGSGSPRLTLTGEIPSPINPPAGCRFHTRCPFRGEGCDTVEPAVEPVRVGHVIACHHWRSILARPEATRDG